MLTKLVFYPALLILMIIGYCADGQTAGDKVCGKWESDENNLVIQVSKTAQGFKARIVSFNAPSVKQMEEYADVNNPNPKLRSRKLVGMSVLEGLVFKPATNSWDDGMIYDSRHGRYWNSSAYINKDGLLKVKGYWHFKFIGRTMTFHRI